MDMEKPKINGKNSNIFDLSKNAVLALKKANQIEEGKEMLNRAMLAKSYEEVRQIIGEYVEIE